MQDRYAADVGDFGKLGMLRILEANGLKVGINWYLVPDESHNADGKHIGYLNNFIYDGCDNVLRDKLRSVISCNERSVKQLEGLQLLKNGTYYHDLLLEPATVEEGYRTRWHENAMETMKECDIVFLDPDNGLLPKSVSKGSKKSIKYVYEDEIIDYYTRGHSVIFYNHRCREKTDVYLKRFEHLFLNSQIENGSKRGISFVRGTIRDYMYIIQPEHRKIVDKSIWTLLTAAWREHFRDLL